MTVPRTPVAVDEVGLTEVSTDDLRQLAESLTLGDLEAPLKLASLGFSGFSHLKKQLDPFQALEKHALLAVIRTALSERHSTAGRRLELVWSGSDSGPSYARYTKVVIPEMIASAKQQITIAGYSFDKGAGIFDRLHEAMAKRGVSVRFFLDVHQLHQRLEQQLKSEKRFSRLKPLSEAQNESPLAYARDVIGLFQELHWPFDGPAPDLYYDPRTAEKYSFASLHAKCLIVDYEQVLITSANFTARGQDRNIEAGVVIHDKGYAAALERQWNNLVESADVLRWGS